MPRLSYKGYDGDEKLWGIWDVLIFVFGGSASGKSAYAQERICEIAGGDRIGAKVNDTSGKDPSGFGTLAAGDIIRMTYLATMVNDSPEANARIEAHRRARAKMGFATVECPRSVGKTAGSCAPFVLLEAASNLLANEMFGDGTAADDGWTADSSGTDAICAGGYGGTKDRCDTSAGGQCSSTAADRVFSDICAINDASEALVVVSDDIFCDGMQYDADTEAYRRALGRLHRLLAAAADEAVEVVCGIPVRRKQPGGQEDRRQGSGS